MTRVRYETATAAALTLGLALSFTAAARAQVGAGLSSGSGEGTGTGYSSGVQRNRSGSVSGVGPGPATGDMGGVIGPRLIPGASPYPPSGFSVPLGPGANTTFPDDSGLFPFSEGISEPGGAKSSDLSQIQPREVEFIRGIADPAERALALQRTGGVAIFSNQLPLSHKALGEAGQAALQIQDPLIHDLRLIAIITTLNSLGDAHLREGKLDIALPPDADADDKAAPLPNAKSDRGILIARADVEWKRAAHLAERILNPTYRSEMLYRVVDSQAFGSQTVVNEFPHGDAESPATADPKAHDPLMSRADQLLVGAAAIARRIDRPVSRDRALVAIAGAAADSKQFARGLEVARMIPQPEVRTDALVKIAEVQARRDEGRGATETYREAAIAVASIPLDDPRAVLAGVLIDNLISVGRFEDARAMVVLYPDTARRMTALGAVAEAQGFRGAFDSGKDWIVRLPAEYRPALYRRLRLGNLHAIEDNRNRELNNRDR